MAYFKGIIIVLISILATGCAYRFGEQDKRIPGGYKLLGVPVFKNDTVHTGLEAYFTRSMIEEIERSELAQVVPLDDSQAFLEGTITSVTFNRGSVVSRETEGDFDLLPKDNTITKEYRVFVRANVVLKRSSDKKVLWQGSFRGEKPYPAPVVTLPFVRTVNPLYNHSARVDNIRLLAIDVMAEAYNEMTENF